MFKKTMEIAQKNQEALKKMTENLTKTVRATTSNIEKSTADDVDESTSEKNFSRRFTRYNNGLVSFDFTDEALVKYADYLKDKEVTLVPDYIPGLSVFPSADGKAQIVMTQNEYMEQQLEYMEQRSKAWHDDLDKAVETGAVNPATRDSFYMMFGKDYVPEDYVPNTAKGEIVNTDSTWNAFGTGDLAKEQELWKDYTQNRGTIIDDKYLNDMRDSKSRKLTNPYYTENYEKSKNKLPKDQGEEHQHPWFLPMPFGEIRTYKYNVEYLGDITETGLGNKPKDTEIKDKSEMSPTQQFYEEIVEGAKIDWSKGDKRLSRDAYNMICQYTTREEAAWLYDVYQQYGNGSQYITAMYSLLPIAQQRFNGEAYEDAENMNPFTKAAAFTINTVMSPLTALDSAADVYKKEWQRYAVDFAGASSRSMAENNMLRKNIGDDIEESIGGTGGRITRGLFDVGTSVIDSATTTAMFAPLGPVAVTVAHSSNAAANGMMNAYYRGATDDEIITMGLTTAAAEYVFEKYSIEKFFEIKNSAKMGDMLKNVLKQTGIEASEETFTEVTNILSDVAIMGKNSEYNLLMEKYKQQGLSVEEAKKKAIYAMIDRVLQAGVGGGLSGGIMGAGGTVIGAYNRYGYNNAMSKDPAMIDYAIQEGLLNPKNTESYKIAAELSEKKKNGKKISAEDIMRLVNVNEQQKASALFDEGFISENRFYEQAGYDGIDFDKADKEASKYITVLDDKAKRTAYENGRQKRATDVQSTVESYGKEYNDEAILPALIEEGMSSPKGTEAYKLAMELSNKVKNNQEVTDYEVGELVAANEAQISGENKNASAEGGKVRNMVMYTTDNTPVAVVEKDILKNVPKSEWVKTAKRTILSQRPSVDVTVREINITRKTAGEYVSSYDSRVTKRKDSSVFEDKLRAAVQLGDVVKASTNYINEGINHERNDNIEQFARGEVLIQVGKNQYKANVLIGTDSNNEMVLYDVVGMEQTNFKYKKGAHTESADYSSAQKPGNGLPSTDTISEEGGIVKGDSRTAAKIREKYSADLAKNSHKGKTWGLAMNKEMMNRVTESERKALLKISEKLDKQIVVKDNLTDAKGRAIAGMITDDAIYLNANAFDKGGGSVALIYIATHEAGHRMKNLAPKQWARYQNYVINKLKNNNTYDSIYERYAEDYPDLTKTEIDEEIACNEIWKTFDSKEALEDFILHERTAAEKLKEVWHRIVNAIGRFLGRSGKGIDIERTRSLWNSAMRAASKAAENSSAMDEVRYSIINIVGQEGNYGKGVFLDTDMFDKVKPRNWNTVLSQYVYKNLAGTDITVYGENGSETISFAKANERVTKDGAKNNHKVIDKLARTKGTINTLSIVHIDELLSVAQKSGTTNDNSHQWLDENGWDLKKAYLMDKNGSIYETTLNIAKARDGRNILYALSNTKKIDDGDVSSASKNEEGLAHKHLSHEGIVTQTKPGVKSQSQGNSKTMRTVDETPETKRIRELEEQLKEKDRLLEDAHMQIMSMEGKGVDTAATMKVAEDIMREFSSHVNKNELHRDITALYNYMSGKNVDSAEVHRRMDEIARKVIAKSYEVVPAAEEYAELRKQIRETRIYVPENERTGFADGYEHFRKSNMGRLLLTNDGMELDSLWAELCNDYPELFDSELTGSEARLKRMLDVYSEFGEQNAPVFDNEEKAVEEVRQRLFGEFWQTPQGEAQKGTPFYELEMEKRKTAKAVESRDKNKIIPMINKNYNHLKNMLNKPTNDRHIPERLRPLVAEVLSNFKEYTALTGEFKNPEMPSATEVKKAALHGMYESIIQAAANNNEALIKQMTDSDLKAKLSQMAERIPKDEDGRFSKFSEMNLEEIQAVSKFIAAVHHIITTENKAFSNTIKENISDLGEKAIAEAREKRSKKTGKKNKEWEYHEWGEGTRLEGFLGWIEKDWKWNELSPIDVFERVGGVAEKLFKAERSGFNQLSWRRRNINNAFQEAVKGVNVNKLTGNHPVKVTVDTSEGKLTLTRAQAMSIYALMKRPAARHHILNGGIQFEKQRNMKKDSTVYRLNEPDIGKIIETLTPQEKKCADAIVEFMSTTAAKWGNETSMALYGYEKFHEENYFPIRVSDGTISMYYGEFGEGNIRTKGFTKAVNKEAVNALMVDDFFDVAIGHCEDMAVYSSLALPTLDFERVLNYKDGAMGTNVRAEMERTYGKGFTNYIKKLHEDINGITRQKKAEGAFTDMFINNTKKAAIGTNIRVALQQPTSIVRSLMFLDLVKDYHFVKGAANFVVSKKLINEMLEHNATAYWKSMGYFEIGVGRGTKDIALDMGTWVQKKGEALATGLYGKLDTKTWAAIWAACKRNIERTNPDVTVGSQEYWNMVNEKFDYVIDKTQVIDSVFHRTQGMRSNNELTKMANSFMSEPLKAINLYRTELYKAYRKGPKAFSGVMFKVGANLTMAAALTAIAQTIPDLWRDDEEEDRYKDGKKIPWTKRFGDKWVNNFLSNLNPLEMLPYAGAVYSMFADNRTPSSMEWQNVKNAVVAITINLANDKITPMAKGWNIIESFSKLVGISYTNAKRDISGIVQDVWRGILGGDEYASYALSKWEYDVNNPENKNKFMRYYDYAIQNGHYEDATMIAEDYLYNVNKGENAPDKEDIQEVLAETGKLKTDKGEVYSLFDMPKDYFSVDGEKYLVSEREYPGYSRDVYETLWKMAGEFIADERYEDYTDEEKMKGFNKIKDFASQSAKLELNGKYDADNWVQDILSGESDINDLISDSVDKAQVKDRKEEIIEDTEPVEGYNDFSPEMQEKADEIISAEASYYAKDEQFGDDYEATSIEKRFEEYDDSGLDDYMSREDYREAVIGYYAYLEVLQEENPDYSNRMKKADVIAYVEMTVEDPTLRRLLFDCLPVGNMKNPF